MDSSGLPFLSEPHDALRDGLVTLKDAAAEVHPVEEIQLNLSNEQSASTLGMMRNVYGSGLPARVQIETQILQRFERLPGLPSSRIGLESLSGGFEDFSFDSYLGLEANSEAIPIDLHSTMEQRLNMRGTKPMRRGIM